MKPRRIAFAALLLSAMTLLGACQGSAIDGLGSQPSSSASTSANGAGPSGQRVAPPAASGTVAEIDGNVVQVQNDATGQVAVMLTAKTAYTQTKSATLAAVTVGSCVFASSSSTASSSSPPTAITATEVRITPAQNGQCERTFARGNAPGQVRPSGAPTSFPTGRVFPSGAAPSGATRNGIGAGISGRVTKVSGSVITVLSDRANSGTSSATITVTASTKYTATVSASRAAVRVGLCMVTEGSTGSDGTVTASRVALSTPTTDGCGLAFRRAEGPAPGATR